MLNGRIWQVRERENEDSFSLLSTHTVHTSDAVLTKRWRNGRLEEEVLN